MQNLVGVAYALATHEQGAIVGVAAYGGINRTREGWDITIVRPFIYLSIGWLPAVLNILSIGFFGLYQRA